MSYNIDYNDAIKKEARSSNDEDLGEVQEVTNGYVLVQRGTIDKEKFYIPQDKVESYDGSVLRFRISENEIKNKYTRDSTQVSIEEQYSSTTVIDSGGGSGGGIHIEDEGTKKGETKGTTTPLIGENLEFSKKRPENQSSKTKEPIIETKTVEVPVTYEEVTIEIRPPSGQTEPKEPVSTKEIIAIPVKKEEIEVSKMEYIKEEVVVKKESVTKTGELNEEVTTEKINTSDIA
ncbi:MAG: DUF2382 domain-containing protein [Nitrosopumilus sp.]|nr:DUF2382 domain-containing protein [Nitrosopumilus sp.]